MSMIFSENRYPLFGIMLKKKEGFRPPVSRALRGLRAFKALVTSPRLPRLFQSPRRMLELVATGALWIDDDVKPTPARCLLDFGLNTNWRWAAGRRSRRARRSEASTAAGG